jgi:uncharacterized protein YjiS (DUF1127 family)
MDETMSLAGTWSVRVPWSPLRSLCHWYRERRTTAALMSLDDAQLKDIGIYRGEIAWLVRKQLDAG